MPAFIGIIGLLLVFVPSSILLLIHSLFYFKGKKYIIPNPTKTGSGLLSVIIPVRKEPLEILNEAFKTIHEWGRKDVEVILVSDDPPELLVELKQLVELWRNKGLNVFLVWRSEARGFRTGALNTGLWASRGKYVYIMDVDSRINWSFFEKGKGLIEEGAAAVVARWTGRNRETRVSEAIYSSMKFIVDALYRGRSALGLPVFPVGTGTLYDAKVLKYELHGWDEKRIQDDMEIGSRLMRLGKRVLFLDNEPIYVEVPRCFKSLRVQQERWAYGATDAAIARFWDILKSKQPWYAKIEALNFLLQYFPAVAGLIGFLIIGPISLFYSLDLFYTYWFLGIPWIAIACLYGYSYIKSLTEAGFTKYRVLVNLGRSATISTSLSPVFTMSFFKALLRRPMIYKRTPKGKYEGLISGMRFPWEAIVGLAVLSTGIILVVKGLLYTGLWSLSYSAGYLYATIRWYKDIFYK